MLWNFRVIKQSYSSSADLNVVLNFTNVTKKNSATSETLILFILVRMGFVKISVPNMKEVDLGKMV